MHDAFFMRRFEALCNLPRDIDRFLDGDGTPAQSFRKVFSLYELENEIVRRFRLLEAVNRGDVLMVQRREQLGFPLEPCPPVVLLCKRFGQNLDRDRTSELCIGGPVDFTHAADTGECGDLVRAELGSHL